MPALQVRQEGQCPSMPPTDSEVVLKADLQAHAYPRDEPMQSDMADYQEVLEPNLSLEERALLNTAREARMTGDALSSATFQSLSDFTESGAIFLSALADLLRQCCQDPSVEERNVRQGGASQSSKQIQVSKAMEAHQVAMKALASMPKFVDSNIAVVNVLMWIVVLEAWHIVLGWFTAIGLPSMTRLIQGFTSILLLRCYYALVVRNYAPDFRYPALHAVRLMTVSTFEGIKNPAGKRPPVLGVILVIRVTVLVQNLYHSWLSALLQRIEELEWLLR